jgi:hypothetical protein
MENQSQRCQQSEVQWWRLESDEEVVGIAVRIVLPSRYVLYAIFCAVANYAMARLVVFGLHSSQGNSQLQSS